MERITRRRLLQGALLTGGALLLPACARSPIPLPTAVPISSGDSKSPYSLTERGDMLVDGRLQFLQHPFLETVMFSFDPILAQGSLVLDTTLKRDCEFRLITEETDSLSSKNPGLIYCMSTREKLGLLRQFPVIRFAPREEYLISLGFKLSGEDCLKTYQDMWTYYITRDSGGKLQGEFKGRRTFDPDASNFRPRDDEALLYFDKGCLA